MGNRGYLMAGLAFLLIIPAVILSVMLINMVNMDESTNNMVKSDNLGHISNDFEASIPGFTREVLGENTAKVVKNGQPIKNSRMVINGILVLHVFTSGASDNLFNVYLVGVPAGTPLNYVKNEYLGIKHAYFILKLWN